MRVTCAVGKSRSRRPKGTCGGCGDHVSRSRPRAGVWRTQRQRKTVRDAATQCKLARCACTVARWPEARRPAASLRAALALCRGGLSAQLLTGKCDPADSVMSSPITSLLVRQRKRRIQDMYTIENVKDRARKVLVLTMSLAALANMEYDCGLVRVRHQLTKTGIPRFVDSGWSCIKTSQEDVNFLEFTALTLGAFHLLHAHFAPVMYEWWLKNITNTQGDGRPRAMETYDILALVLSYMHLPGISLNSVCVYKPLDMLALVLAYMHLPVISLDSVCVYI
jgi:hypothetical protein